MQGSPIDDRSAPLDWAPTLHRYELNQGAKDMKPWVAVVMIFLWALTLWAAVEAGKSSPCSEEESFEMRPVR
jgi:hypothetical protein